MTSGIAAVGGLICFVVYFITLNMAVGGIGIFLIFPGAILFYTYWKKEDDIITEKSKAKQKCNSLSIYEDNIKFENMAVPTEYYMKCRNTGEKVNVNIWPIDQQNCRRFILPDTQYMDPSVFGQRVLQLPAHRKIFTKRQDILQKLKPLFVILGIIVVWILIITTTGDDNSEVAQICQQTLTLI